MNKQKQIVDSIKGVVADIDKLKRKQVELINDAIKQIFIDFPKLEVISMSINNHEFNDGGPTYFSIYFEEASVVIEGEEKECGDVPAPIRESINMLFSETQEIHEFMFAKDVDRLYFLRSNFLGE